MKKFLFIVLAILALLTGAYPLIYFLVELKYTFLKSKAPEILNNPIWISAFFLHITFGALSLFIGWRQFGSSFRNKHLSLHRIIGTVYVSAVIISAVSGIYIGFSANGGMAASLGFISLGIIWLAFTLLALFKIKNGNIEAHRKFMVYSYACTFAAVTLRLWYPFLKSITGDPDFSYITVAWLCWVPNILTAYFINRKHAL